MQRTNKEHEQQLGQLMEEMADYAGAPKHSKVRLYTVIGMEAVNGIDKRDYEQVCLPVLESDGNSMLKAELSDDERTKVKQRCDFFNDDIREKSKEIHEDMVEKVQLFNRHMKNKQLNHPEKETQLIPFVQMSKEAKLSQSFDDRLTDSEDEYKLILQDQNKDNIDAGAVDDRIEDLKAENDKLKENEQYKKIEDQESADKIQKLEAENQQLKDDAIAKEEEAKSDQSSTSENTQGAQ